MNRSHGTSKICSFFDVKKQAGVVLRCFRLRIRARPKKSPNSLMMKMNGAAVSEIDCAKMIHATSFYSIGAANSWICLVVSVITVYSI